MSKLSRRKFTKQLLQSITAFALLESAFLGHAFGKAVSPITDHWAAELEEYCQDLRKDSLSPEEWQERVEGLFAKVDLSELVRFIELEKIQQNFPLPDLGVHTEMVKFPQLTGLPERTTFIKKVFGMQKDRAIIPHGHRNMVSAHLILEGQMHLRHFDSVDVDGSFWHLRPTIDKIVKPGDYSSISDGRDNVHWFVAESERAFTFDVILLDLAENPYEIHNLDMEEATSINGTLRVPELGVEKALEKYGKISHH